MRKGKERGKIGNEETNERGRGLRRVGIKENLGKDRKKKRRGLNTKLIWSLRQANRIMQTSNYKLLNPPDKTINEYTKKRKKSNEIKREIKGERGDRRQMMEGGRKKGHAVV